MSLTQTGGSGGRPARASSEDSSYGPPEISEAPDVSLQQRPTGAPKPKRRKPSAKRPAQKPSSSSAAAATHKLVASTNLFHLVVHGVGDGNYDRVCAALQAAARAGLRCWRVPPPQPSHEAACWTENGAEADPGSG